MKYVIKKTEPATFGKWKKQNSNVNWDKFSSPESTHRDIYLELRKELIKQQEKICCYCEIALRKEIDTHIEHLQDQHNHPNVKYDFNNLLASCQNYDSCGHKKGRGYFKNMVSPLQANCQDRFTYTGTGKMIPNDENDSFAQKTIELLGLNCKRLKDRRISIIKALENSNTDYLNLSLNYCVDWYSGFYTVIEYMNNQCNFRRSCTKKSGSR